MHNPNPIILAPMEGVMDAPLRRTITAVGGVDRCVTEFIRVVDAVLPDKVFYRLCPELKTGGCTDSGVPVRVQLLGSDAPMMAENALRAVALGSLGVDINFGCPSKTVNGSCGGAYLLQHPDDIYNVVNRVRRLVPHDKIVSAKMRLGWDSTDNAVQLAQIIEDAGADELVVHARTKAQEYRPPVHWEKIAEIQDALSIPVIANGDIVDRESYDTCRAVSGCDTVMIGRGILANPYLGLDIKSGVKRITWTDMLKLLLKYNQSAEIMGAKTDGRYLANRLKQWVRYMMPQFPQAEEFFIPLRLLHDRQSILDLIHSELDKIELLDDV